MKTASFTLHFWGLVILALPMEIVSGVPLVLRQTCGQHVHGIYSSG